MRIGITQRVDVSPHGERRNALDQAWFPYLRQLDVTPVPLPNTPEVVAYAESLELQGLLLSGGNDIVGLGGGGSNEAPERDQAEASLLTWAGAKAIPVVAVCRGLQFMIHHYGGTLTAIEGHVATEHEVRWTDGSPVQWRRTQVNSYHNYGCRDGAQGPGLAALALDQSGFVEAARHTSLPQVGIMWHPERGEPADEDQHLIKAVFSRSF